MVKNVVTAVSASLNKQPLDLRARLLELIQRYEARAAELEKAIQRARWNDDKSIEQYESGARNTLLNACIDIRTIIDKGW